MTRRKRYSAEFKREALRRTKKKPYWTALDLNVVVMGTIELNLYPFDM